ncbi:ribonuclease E inhibitor RraB [Aquimarina aquimarini]|uniref:ribonuclease E inhibitor RraB n=1 Tax=Aquimarina aquimarini TaxID=1191734 RepID=UPI000D54C6FA|nr:ribonuclease E inhibitor RraB [Aquimarina aquimarini]
MIIRETIEDFFENVNNGDEFDTSSKLLWGFFFLDSDKKKLEKAAEKLVKEGYRYVNIFEAEKENDDDVQEYYLHIEKVEHHSVDTIDARNKELYLFVEQNNIDCYDGFDVGNIISSENITR